MGINSRGKAIISPLSIDEELDGIARHLVALRVGIKVETTNARNDESISDKAEEILTALRNQRSATGYRVVPPFNTTFPAQTEGDAQTALVIINVEWEAPQ